MSAEVRDLETRCHRVNRNRQQRLTNASGANICLTSWNWVANSTAEGMAVGEIWKILWKDRASETDCWYFSSGWQGIAYAFPDTEITDFEARRASEGSGNTRLSLPEVVMESKASTEPSIIPDGTGIDDDRPEFVWASVTFAGKTGACSSGKNCCGTDVQIFVKSEKIKNKTVLVQLWSLF